MKRKIHEAYARTLIEEERQKQDAKWSGPAHDDMHTPEEWRTYIAEHLAKTLDHLPVGSAVAERAIQVAALGYAGIEAGERAVQRVAGTAKEDHPR